MVNHIASKLVAPALAAVVVLTCSSVPAGLYYMNTWKPKREAAAIVRQFEQRLDVHEYLGAASFADSILHMQDLTMAVTGHTGEGNDGSLNPDIQLFWKDSLGIQVEKSIRVIYQSRKERDTAIRERLKAVINGPIVRRISYGANAVNFDPTFLTQHPHVKHSNACALHDLDDIVKRYGPDMVENYEELKQSLQKNLWAECFIKEHASAIDNFDAAIHEKNYWKAFAAYKTFCSSIPQEKLEEFSNAKVHFVQRPAEYDFLFYTWKKLYKETGQERWNLNREHPNPTVNEGVDLGHIGFRIDYINPLTSDGDPYLNTIKQDVERVILFPLNHPLGDKLIEMRAELFEISPSKSYTDLQQITSNTERMRFDELLVIKNLMNSLRQPKMLTADQLSRSEVLTEEGLQRLLNPPEEYAQYFKLGREAMLTELILSHYNTLNIALMQSAADLEQVSEIADAFYDRLEKHVFRPKEPLCHNWTPECNHLIEMLEINYRPEKHEEKITKLREKIVRIRNAFAAYEGYCTDEELCPTAVSEAITCGSDVAE